MDCFEFEAIMKKSALNICIQMFTALGVGWLGHIICVCLTLEEMPKLLPKGLCYLNSSHNV